MALPSDAYSIGGGLYEDSEYYVYDSSGNELGTDNLDGATYTATDNTIVNFPAGVTGAAASSGSGSSTTTTAPASSSSNSQTSGIITDIGSALGLGNSIVNAVSGKSTTPAKPGTAPLTAVSSTTKYLMYGIVFVVIIGVAFFALTAKD